MKIKAHHIDYMEWVIRFKFGKTHGFSMYFSQGIPKIEWPTLYWEE